MACLDVDLSKELAYKRDDLRYLLFISGLFWRLLEHGLKEQRVARESGSRFHQISVSSNLRESGLRSVI